MKSDLLSNYFANNRKTAVPMTGQQKKARDLVLGKIEKGIYRFENTPCPVCGEDDFTALSAKDAYGIPIGVVLCNACRFVYTNPRFTLDSLSAFYKTEYRQIERGSKVAQDAYFQLQLVKGETIYNFLAGIPLVQQKILSRPDQYAIIEVGCGAGGILQYFRTKGFKVLGCDLGEEYLKYGIQKHNLDLYAGGIDDLSLILKENNVRVGVVLYEQTFEHIYDLKQELQKIKTLITSDSFLFIGVPGIRNADRHYNSNFLHYIQPGHLWHFDLHNLTRILNANGFHKVSGDETIKSVFSLTSNPEPPQETTEDSDLLNFLVQMEKKRRIKRIKSIPGRLIHGAIDFPISILRRVKRKLLNQK